MAEKGVVSEILKQKLGEHKSPSRPKKEEVQRTSITLPAGLYRQLKAYAAMEGRKLNELMVELLREALKKRMAEKDIFQEWDL